MIGNINRKLDAKVHFCIVVQCCAIVAGNRVGFSWKILISITTRNYKKVYGVFVHAILTRNAIVERLVCWLLFVFDALNDANLCLSSSLPSPTHYTIPLTSHICHLTNQRYTIQSTPNILHTR